MDLFKEREKYCRRRRVCGIFGWIFGITAFCAMIASAVLLVIVGVSARNTGRDFIFASVAAGLIVGAIVFGLFAYWLFQCASRAEKKEKDCAERIDSEDSFFVGDGTLATFTKEELRLHAAAPQKGSKTIRVPYAEIRLFSVCTRRAPKEKGEWSAVLEIPVKYLAKSGKAEKGEPPALIQTDGKERLYACLEKYGLTLVGERPPRGEAEKAEKFTLLKKFVIPDRKKRKTSAVIAAVGLAAVIAGGAIAFTLSSSVGSVLAVFGIFFAAKFTYNFFRAKSSLSVYREGLYWSEENRAERVFLKWEEIIKISAEEKDGLRFVRAECPYGAFRFPDAGGVYEEIERVFPEKCVKEVAEE